jgi:hypothetical protein
VYQKLVQHPADLQKPLRALFPKDTLGSPADILFPVWSRYGIEAHIVDVCWDRRETRVLSVQGIEGKQGSTKVPVGKSGEERGHVGGQTETLLLCDVVENLADLFVMPSVHWPLAQVGALFYLFIRWSAHAKK